MFAWTARPAGVAASDSQAPACLAFSRRVGLQHPIRSFNRCAGQDPAGTLVLRPPVSGGGRCYSRRYKAAAAPVSAAAAAVTAAGAAAEVTFFPAAMWAKCTAAVIGVYLTYWLGLAKVMPR